MTDMNTAASPPEPGARRFGRIKVLRMVTEPLDEAPELDVEGCRLDIVRSGGAITARIVEEGTDVLLATVTLHVDEHGDPFYGKWSKSDDRYCYGSALEVRPEARGKRLGTHITRIGRGVAFQSGGRGAFSLVAPDNAPSLRVHEREGFRPTVELTGIRLGPRVLWFRKRKVGE